MIYVHQVRLSGIAYIPSGANLKVLTALARRLSRGIVSHLAGKASSQSKDVVEMGGQEDDKVR